MSGDKFPLNAWYAAAWDVELGRKLTARTICGKPLVMYRKQDGSAVALADACWHRLLPLSRGELHGDNVICGYHGLEFDDTGRCVYMPSQDTINPSACVKSYPVVERHRFLWVWPGDPAMADPALVPDLHWNDHPDWAADGKVIHVKCDYRLVLDNLMDLTHETYVTALRSATARWPRRPSPSRTPTAPRPSPAGCATSSRRPSGARS
jgi:phenylpropionate dioxygenase-like ring-hydroxylating dioxygenase large terminal subunit